MEWLQTPLAVGLAALFAGLFTWLATRTQIKAQTEREDRQWVRQVKSKALLAFSEELALLASKSRMLIGLMRLSHGPPGGYTPERAGKLLGTALDDWRDYYRKGSFRDALFRLDDEEIIERAEAIDGKYLQAAGVFVDLSRETSAEKLAEAREALSRGSTRDQGTSVANQ